MYHHIRTTYHDIILGHGQPVLRGRYTFKNFWGEQSRWQRRSIRYRTTAIQPQDDERFENRRFYLSKGGGAHHCRLCAAVHHKFHERRAKWRETTGDKAP